MSFVLHPATVHIPIGVFFAACVLTFIAWKRHAERLEESGYTMVIFAWYSLIPTTVTGTIDAVRHLRAPTTPPDALFWINLHAVSALLLWIVIWQAWQLRRRIKDTPVWQARTYRAYALRLGIGMCFVALSGWSGGHMVYVLRLGILPN